jgi:hypothetical protein
MAAMDSGGLAMDTRTDTESIVPGRWREGAFALSGLSAGTHHVHCVHIISIGERDEG